MQERRFLVCFPLHHLATLTNGFLLLRWGDKGCCLPKGGPSNPPSPPTGTKCPKDTHYWRNDKDCCVPRQPEPKPPKCPTNWEWKQNQHKCKPCPTPPSPPKNHPSPKPNYQKKKDDDYKKDDDHKNDDDHRNGGHKRSTGTRVPRCPSGLEACPFAGHYECFDTATELESCGGCASLGKGQDCTKIEGAWNVACERGSCKGTLFSSLSVPAFH